ncbi:hypothetical protein Emin_1078 [Elusimicrobium minutum Pei191]|uniref:Uncharacterized protein n=1 Tax=Elusimicrobium minutum (strain Pei191) TaxID=445932 RepID=B2KDN4_ELUMP|nr:hypothetical protein [Elusimicrobium minutum]ACC98630.1 hypothetical protein Emin_1078 [Elusimicrobium minutum Pei191]
MTKYSSINIYTPGLFTKLNAPDIYNGFEFEELFKEFSVNFEKEETFDALFFKETNIKTVVLKNGVEIFLNREIIAPNMFINFNETSAVSLNITLMADDPIRASGFKLVKKLFNLGNTSVSFTRADYSKQGHFYLNNGSLMLWKEYQKAGGTLVISNCGFKLKENLLKAFDKYSFLIFELNPGLDESAVYELALIKPPSEKFNIKTGLFDLELNLTER